MANRAHAFEQVVVSGARCKQQTEQAILVEVDGREPFWIPNSLVHDLSEVYKAGTDGTLVIPRFKAEQLELEHDDHHG